MSAEFGVIGLAVMGQNLALNVERSGFKCAVFNRTTARTEEFAEKHKGKNFIFTKSLEEFCASLATPRKLLLMVKSGQAVDDFINKLLPFLSPGDIILDGGNSFFEDSERRFIELEQRKIHFIGLGISGGELGALWGPALMAGCSDDAWKHVSPILKTIAAKAPQDNEPCCANMGPRGAGHATKTIHNGIEYALLQLIAETYDVFRNIGGMSADQIADVFQSWSKGDLASYLIEISHVVLRKKDDRDPSVNIVDVIVDAAKQKGTGKWTSQMAMDLNAPIPTIDVSTGSRFISSFKDIRTSLSKKIDPKSNTAKHVTKIDMDRLAYIQERSLLAAFILSYVQGLDMLAKLSLERSYDTSMVDVAKVWRAGCIIRHAKLLQDFTNAYSRNPSTQFLMADDTISSMLAETIPFLREVVVMGVSSGVPVAALASALEYFDAMHTEYLPANLVQGLRDCFGAHTYQRLDETDKNKTFHTEWME
ncbi:hypothetical protein GEMRC1_013127 [Eukaryota sp. GEM-RC1]